MSHKLFDLPLGARFRYFGTDDKCAYVLLDRDGCGRIAHAIDDDTPKQFQGLYSAAESHHEFVNMLVEFVPVKEVK